MIEKLDGQSLDLVKENVEKLKELFPSIVKEDKIDLEELELLLGENINRNKEQYSFTWNGKTEATKLVQKRSTGTLRPCKEESRDWDTTQNLYIEGDNLEVLRLLQASYNGRIKMIYIDPPYNTGHDFVYKDNFEDNIKNYKEQTGQAQKSNADTDGRYHTNWLNMMYPRLKLARNLLKDEGVIFISIDDNEITNLRKICDEVFGENNFVDTLKWKRKKQPSFLATHTAKLMEYILIYAKKKENLEKLSIEGTSDATKKIINISNKETKRHFNAGVKVKIEGEGVIKAGKYTIKTMDVEYLNDVYFKNGKTLNDVDVIARFTDSQESINKFINENLLFISRQYGLRRDVSEEEKGKRKSITDLLLDWGDNQDSDKEFIELFGAKYFEYVKPTKLIFNLIKSNFTEDEIVLDFFSGSGTTAEAVIKTNVEDNGNRQFICVQLPENLDKSYEFANNEEKKSLEKVLKFLDSINKPHFITEIGKERIRRAGEKIKEENPDKQIDIGFKVFKLDGSNLKKWDNTPTKDVDVIQDRIQTSIDYIKDDRNELDLVYEVMLKYGIDLSLPITKTQNDKAYIIEAPEYKLLVCTYPNLTIEDIEDFANESVGTYLFADRCFNTDNLLVNAEEILKSRNKEMRLF